MRSVDCSQQKEIKMLKRIIFALFGCYRQNAQIIIKIFGIKLKFKSFVINQLEDVCCIQNIENLKLNEVYFPHPIGIVIHPNVVIGKQCVIFQNVTIGQGRYNENLQRNVPIIGDGVTIYPNSVIVGGINIGKNSVIGAGSVVINDIPPDAVAAGNPAKVIRYKNSV